MTATDSTGIDFSNPITRKTLAERIESSRAALLSDFHKRVRKWVTRDPEFDCGRDAAIRWVEDPNQGSALFALNIYDHVVNNDPTDDDDDDELSVKLCRAVMSHLVWDMGEELEDIALANCDTYVRGFMFGVAEWMAEAIAMRSH